MVVDAIPLLLLLRSRMSLIVEDTLISGNSGSDDETSDNGEEEEEEEEYCPTPAVIRIASHAAVTFIDKYLDLMWDCDIYIIAMGGQF